MEEIEQKNSWTPTTADGTAAGSYTMRVWKTEYGPVEYRATVGGKKVAYTTLRSSYMHEADSIIGFQMLNDPDYVKSPQTFQSAAQHINFTFNWFYADSSHTAYYNSGNNPVRASGVDSEFPVWGQAAYEWKNWDPTTNTSDYTPASAHPNSVDQDYYISWNNKQALDYTTASWGDGSVHRGNLIDDRVKKLVAAAWGHQILAGEGDVRRLAHRPARRGRPARHAEGGQQQHGHRHHRRRGRHQAPDLAHRRAANAPRPRQAPRPTPTPTPSGSWTPGGHCW